MSDSQIATRRQLHWKARVKTPAYMLRNVQSPRVLIRRATPEDKILQDLTYRVMLVCSLRGRHYRLNFGLPIVIASLFLALNFAAVGHAEVNGTIPSIGGRYFHCRVEIPVPAFAQDDPRWSEVRLGPSTDTLGDEGCAVTSAAMVVAFYGIKTDPQQLNNFLTRAGGFSDDGLIQWSRVQAIAPGYLKLAYNGYPSYELIDSNLLEKNPVIAIIRLPDGAYHFVVIVGKEGRKYLIRDPAASPFRQPYPLSELTDRIEGVCFFRRM